VPPVPKFLSLPFFLFTARFWTTSSFRFFPARIFVPEPTSPSIFRPPLYASFPVFRGLGNQFAFIPLPFFPTVQPPPLFTLICGCDAFFFCNIRAASSFFKLLSEAPEDIMT